MLKAAWQKWIGHLTAQAAPTRRQRRDRHHWACEILEERAMLTAPVVVDGANLVNEDTVLAASVAALGTDADADPLTFAKNSDPLNGMLVLNSDGTFTYTPNLNFNGLDSFTFFANDGSSDSNIGTYNIVVNPVNDAPVVVNGFANPNEDLAFPGTLVPLATDTEGNALTFAAVSQPLHGTVTVNTNGTFTYTPAANYFGTDLFTFRANDGSANSNLGVFNLNVSPVDDGLKLTFPSGVPVISRNSDPVRIDPAVTLADVDTPLNYANTHIRAVMTSGNSKGDLQKGRVGLKILSQGKGDGLVRTDNGQIYYGNNDISIGTYSGGTLGRSLVIQFRNKPEVTAEAVNAVLRQISIFASKKATSITSGGQTGIRTIDVTVDVANESSIASKTVSIV